MRKLALTYELIEEICTYIENGNSNNDTCKLVGISDSSFYSWLADAEKFQKGEEVQDGEIKLDLLDNIKRAEAGFKAFHINNITKSSRKEWTASAWLLERKFPKEFGRIDRNAIMLSKADNGMLKQMNELLQEMALGDDEDSDNNE
jgi:hypothetical protein